MIDRLPYDLTKGVTATREGIDVHMDRWTQIIYGLGFDTVIEFHVSESGGRLIPWYSIAERLRYRKGEPWCKSDKSDHGLIMCLPANTRPRSFWPLKGQKALARIAVILCARKDGEDAEAFRVLHWCIENLGRGDKVTLEENPAPSIMRNFIDTAIEQAAAEELER